jgi:hypothetical protein
MHARSLPCPSIFHQCHAKSDPKHAKPGNDANGQKSDCPAARPTLPERASKQVQISSGAVMASECLRPHVSAFSHPLKRWRQEKGGRPRDFLARPEAQRMRGFRGVLGLCAVVRASEDDAGGGSEAVLIVVSPPVPVQLCLSCLLARVRGGDEHEIADALLSDGCNCGV